jgi:hypothetical protein
VAAAEEGEESEQMEQEGDHPAEILSGSKPTDQPLGGGRNSGERQAPINPGRFMRWQEV